MADKKKIREGFKKGVFESPVGSKSYIAGTEVKSKERGYEIIVGDEAVERLKQLGVSDGMTIPVHDNAKSEISKRTSRPEALKGTDR